MCVLKDSPCRKTSRLIYYASPYSISLSCFPGDRMERPEVGVKRKFQEADLCHVNQRQSILNISMTKLRITPIRRVEPSLRRKVLIFNTLRHIEYELREEGSGWSPPHCCPSLVLPSIQPSEDLTLDPPPPIASENSPVSMDVNGGYNSPPTPGPQHLPNFQSEIHHQSSLANESHCVSSNPVSNASPVSPQSPLPTSCPANVCGQSPTLPVSPLPPITLPCARSLPANSMQTEEHISPQISLHSLQPMAPVSETVQPCNNSPTPSYMDSQQTPAQPFTDYFSDNKCILDSFASLLEPEPMNGTGGCLPYSTSCSSISNVSNITVSSSPAVPVTAQQQEPHQHPKSCSRTSSTQPQTHLTVLSTASHCQSSSSSSTHHSYTSCSWSSSSGSSTLEDFFTDFETATAATAMDFDLMLPLPSSPTIISSSSTTFSPMFTNTIASLSTSSCGTISSAASVSHPSTTATLKLTPLSSEDILQTLPCADSFPSFTSNMSSCNPKTDLPWDDLENVMQLLVGMI